MASRDSTKRFYQSAETAGHYADKHRSTWVRRLANRGEQGMISRALDLLWQGSRPATLLDLPCGAGRMLPLLAAREVEVLAMDSSCDMIQEAKVFAEGMQKPVRFLAGSAYRIPLPDGAVDALVCSRLLHHVEDPASRIRLLSELARVTRMGMVVTFFDACSFSALRRKRVAARRGRPSARFSMTRAQCVSEARSAGLKLVGMKAMLRYYAEVTAAVFVKS